MSVLSTVNRTTEPLRPSDGVVVVGSETGEAGYEGYVSRTVPTNGDDVYVTITKGAGLVGSRLSYKRSSLVLTRRNGK